MNTEALLDLKTVYDCNRSLDCRTQHPLISLVCLSSPLPSHSPVRFGFYTILLIENTPDDSPCCGRRSDDYSYATLVFLMPGEIFRLNESRTWPSKGYLLIFHPDLLFQTPLKKNIRNYTFFRYHKEESLHLSQRETQRITGCLHNIGEELYHPVDTHSSLILSHHIELLLDYCSRYYERQFITREDQNQALLTELENLLDKYIRSGRLQTGNLPTAGHFANSLHLSPAYFSDLLKFETGQTFHTYFQLKRLEVARQMLRTPGISPTAVARQLGYRDLPYCHIE